MKVALLLDGGENASPASLAAGQTLGAALEQAGHQVVRVQVGPSFVSTLRAARPDTCFIALSGSLAHDGSVQALLDLLDLPFVGARAAACSMAWNASQAKGALDAYRKEAGVDGLTVSVPVGYVLTRAALGELGAKEAYDLLEDRIPAGYPLHVQPLGAAAAHAGRRVDGPDQLEQTVDELLDMGEAVYVREWVEGVVLSVPVLGEGWNAYALPPCEHVADCAPGLQAPVRPASLSVDEGDAQAIRAEIERAALEVHQAFGLRDASVVDLVWDGARPCLVGLDAVPSMAEGKPLPAACAAAGLSLPALMDALVNASFE